MKTGEYAEAVNQAGYGDQHRPYGACHAPGCPMSGSLTDSTSGTDTWFCALHFGAPGGLWNDITARANNRLPELLVAMQLRIMSPNDPIPPHARQALGAAKRLDVIKGHTMARSAGRHLFGVIEQEIKHPALQPQIQPLVDDGEYA